jgi:pre-mRNA-processing factor 39
MYSYLKNYQNSPITIVRWQQFVDLCGTIHDLSRAWNQHIRLFPHSLRTASSKHPATGAKALKLVKEVRDETFVAKPHQPSGDSSSNLMIQLPLQDNKMSPSENPDTQSDQAPTNISEERLPSLETNDNQFESVAIDQLQSGEAHNSLPERLEQESPKVSEWPRGNTPNPNMSLVQGEQLSPKVTQQLKRDSPEPSVSSLDLIGVKGASPGVSKQPREDTYEQNVSSVDLVSHVAKGTESVQASQEYLKEYDVQQQYEHDMKPPSLENLSLNTQNDRSPDSVPSTSHKWEAPEETCVSNGSMRESSCNASPDASLYGLLGTQASAKTEIEVVNSSSSMSHQNLIPTQALRQPQVTANIGGNWRQKNNSDRFHRNSKFGFRGQHSQRKLHQQRQESQQYSQAEMDAQIPQGYTSQPFPSLNTQVQQSSEAQNQYQAAAAQTNIPTHHAWPMQNVQQQSFATESQLPAPPASSQTSQYPMQSNGQYGHMQNSEYNQMWQNYYYQQQQFLLQQQQLQLQQQQQQPQQQYQQQLQQHYHQQPAFLQQQQLQQLQQQQQYNQQQQFLQQQQQHLFYLHQQQQLPLQHQQQQQQSPPLLEQQQPPLLEQQQPPLQEQQQEELEQEEHQQHNTPSKIQT